MTEIYERIEELCKNKGITVTALCKECEIPRATLSDYKVGRIKSLSASVILKIADYFNLSTDYLMSGKTKDELSNLKIALFGGDAFVTDEMLNEVKRYAMYIKERENGDKKTL